MKILHVVTGLEIGGAEHVLERLVAGDALNEHVVVSLSEEGALGRRLTNRGIVVCVLGLERSKWPPLKSAWKLWRIMRVYRPDVVQTWMYHANLFASIVARLAGVRSICWNIRRTAPPRTRSTRLISYWGAKLSRFLPDKIIACAEAAVTEHVRQGYCRERFTVIPNGIDAMIFAPSESVRQSMRGALGIDDRTIVIGCVGRFHPDKDHETLFQAIRLVHERFSRVVCLLAGTDTDSSNREIRALANRCGLSAPVFYLGPRLDIPEVLNAIDLHVSSSATEGFPNAVAEAMACAIPCVSTDVGDARLIIGQSGWIVPPGDPTKLASMIAQALSQMGTKNWTSRKRACRERCIELFSLKRMIELYQDTWQGCCARGLTHAGASK